jgi:excisionase family DNA binding protein
VELKTKIPAEEELLTVNESRAWLRLGRTKVNELLQSGELPSLKVGRRRFVRRGDVTEWLEQCHCLSGEEG